jgi:hypothetical protein
MAEKRVTWAILSSLITQLWAKIKANFTNKIEVIKVNGSVQSVAADKSVDITIPAQKTKLSEFDNDTGFITKAVSDLANYYKKAETYTKAEVDSKVSAIPKFDIKVVQQLPTTGISKTTIYLVKTGAQTDNLFTEYIRVADGSTDKWEELGTQKVDLSGYLTKTEASNTYQPFGKYANRNGDELEPFSTFQLHLAGGSSIETGTDPNGNNNPCGIQINYSDTKKVVLKVFDTDGAGAGQNETYVLDLRPLADPEVTAADVTALLNSLT